MFDKIKDFFANLFGSEKKENDSSQKSSDSSQSSKDSDELDARTDSKEKQEHDN